MRYLLTALVALGASCSVETRSDGFRCDPDGGCSGGRICQDGWCVSATGDGDGDSDCPAVCDSCAGGACQISGTSVVCPPQMACEVSCEQGGSCLTVDCSEASRCEIDCIGGGSCGEIECGDSDCSVRCNGTQTCFAVSGTGRVDVVCEGTQSCGAIDCSDACACTVSCIGNQSCTGGPLCPADCDIPGGCGCDFC